MAARSRDVTQTVLAPLTSRPALHIVDLGCGTGSNARFLSTFMAGARPHWRFVDHDAGLLAVARSTFGEDVETRVTDLRTLDASLLDGCELVTASALLDLVSERWLRDFVAACRRVGARVLVALNYDGRMTCDPPDADDSLVRDLVNQHQRTDKGFGPALGPDAGACAASLLREAGYDVVRATSDWTIGPDDLALQRALIRGWADAAIELSPPDSLRIAAWQSRRLSHISAGNSRLIVGHDDVGAWRG